VAVNCAGVLLPLLFRAIRRFAAPRPRNVLSNVCAPTKNRGQRPYHMCDSQVNLRLYMIELF
jgi:hypothetical protein